MSELKLEITKKEDVPLLSRERIVCWATFDGPIPSRKEMRAKICSQLNAPLENCVVKHIYPRFGNNKVKVVVHLYKSAEHAKKIEEGHVMKKMEGKVKAAAGAAA